MKMSARYLFMLVGLGVALLNLTSPAPSKVDFGQWRAVVVHSDDWGLEGWVPKDIGDSLRLALADGVPHWQEIYLASSLETAGEVQLLATALERIRDLDDLPLVLQANTILAGPSVREAGTASSWPIHESGAGPDYHRPGLEAAIDGAIESGVWWPELHGLTHYNLSSYARARARGDRLALAAAAEGAFAYEGFRADSELDDSDRAAALAVARESVRRFSTRFGRAPTSIIAPDYRWGSEDEAAWRQAGLSIVQARREQVDATLPLHTLGGRARKWLRRQLLEAGDGLFGVERTVDLEPYGDPNPAAPQGAEAAFQALREAFADGLPGVVSIHRVQLLPRAEGGEAAGLQQLQHLFSLLHDDGGVRILVDTEVEQLWRRGWSIRSRGSGWLVRNWTSSPRRVTVPDGRSPVIPPRSSVWFRNNLPAYPESRN
ncbi:hypothetical protein DRQ53_11360 [bacterium]|nr:MAG: hypothetical protein DRQ53_11360 [bacterium]